MRSGKNSWRSRRIKEETLPQERREELQGRATILRVPRCLSPFQGNLFSLHCVDFQAEDRLTPRWHVGQPCGKDSWERLVGKPRGKATDPLIYAKGRVTLLLQLERKSHVHAPIRARTDSPGETPEEPQIHVSTGEESSGSGTNSTEGLRPRH